MRFWKKKFYREVSCKFCNGLGKVNIVETIFDNWTGKLIRETNSQKYCECCNGKGTQTVLEREE